MNNADDDSLVALAWPDLSERYDVALRQAVTFIIERYDPVGIIACGSIIRGNPNPGSDFDLYVVHNRPFRQRVQRFFSDVPAEIFVNTPTHIREYFAEERAEGRPGTAHMLSTGFAVLDRDPVVQELVAEAHDSLAQPFHLPESKLVWLRYTAVDLLDNAVDLRALDPDNAEMTLQQAVNAMVEYAFVSQDCYLPRAKERLLILDEFRPEIGELVRALYRQADQAGRFDVATQLAARLLGETTFFEWETDPEYIQRKG